MKIWIVFCTDMSAAYSDCFVYSIFDTEEAADNHRNHLCEIETDSFGYYVVEYEVQHAD